MKRHRVEDPRIQQELNIALGYHARAGNERGINLCLWAGADAHAPAPNPEWGLPEDPDPENGEDPFIGWSAVEEAAREGHLKILKRLGPNLPGAAEVVERMVREARAVLATLGRLPR